MHRQYACTYGGDEKEGRDALLPEGETAHFDEVLCDLRDALLAFVDSKVGPMYKLLVNLPCGRQFRACPENMMAGMRTCSRALV